MKFKLLASSLLMSGIFALSGAVSVANANSLTIVDGVLVPVVKPIDPNTLPY